MAQFQPRSDAAEGWNPRYQPQAYIAGQTEDCRWEVGPLLDEDIGQHQGSTGHPRKGWPAWRWPVLQIIIALGGLIFGQNPCSHTSSSQPRRLT